jgi:ribosomal protein S27E
MEESIRKRKNLLYEKQGELNSNPQKLRIDCQGCQAVTLQYDGTYAWCSKCAFVLIDPDPGHEAPYRSLDEVKQISRLTSASP